MKEHVRIVEVGPRDGLQNERQPVDVETKVSLIERLVAAGVTHIEAASFVSPKWVPQMAGSADVMQNKLLAGCDEVAVFGAASEALSQKNINCSIAESLDRFREVANAAIVSCVMGCPYEGNVDPAQTVQVELRLLDMGCPVYAARPTSPPQYCALGTLS